MIKDFFRHNRGSNASNTTAVEGHVPPVDGVGSVGAHVEDEPIRLVRLHIFAMGAIVSLGGLIFGFDTGQISGFVNMPDFLARFADQPGPAFSNGREGTIVGLLSIGTLVGSLAAGLVADFAGRKKAIVFWTLWFIIGVLVQITTSQQWVQIAIGRLIAGFGVGGLSVSTPLYQSETAPRQIRGALVSMYQLFITFGIFLAYCINYGTEKIPNASSWRITMGIGFIFPVLMAVGIMFLDESPRWDYRKGHVERARATVAHSYGVPESHWEVEREMRDIKRKLEEETTGARKWHEVFSGPRMAYRTVLGCVLQSLQQLTGANFFFYYGTSIFQRVGIPNSFVTQMILGGVNFGCTFPGLYVVEHLGRRSSLIIGGIGMFVSFLIFASVGHFEYFMNDNVHTAGTVMIVFTCIFILFYATTWGPIIWALVGEIYPSRYRAKSMGFATASNWMLNFLISFFTPYIINDIDFRYGYVFAGCCGAGALIVFLFVPESAGRSLEEIDTMYVTKVTPWKSKHWEPPTGEEWTRIEKERSGEGSDGSRKDGGADDRLERASV